MTGRSSRSQRSRKHGRDLKAAIPGVAELSRFTFEIVPPGGFVASEHLHHHHQLDFVLSGQLAVHIEGRSRISLGRGEGLLIPPLVRHVYGATRGSRKGTFKFHLAPQYWPSLGAWVRKVVLSPGLRLCLRDWARRFEAGAPYVAQEAVTLLTLCLLPLLAESKTRARGPGRLDSFREKLWPVLERVANDPHAGWTVSRLASECKLSLNGFSRLFHAVIRQTAQRYLFDARMRAVAAELVSRPPRPIKEIAEHARYANIHSFTHAFKEAFGVSPAAYRRERTGR